MRVAYINCPLSQEPIIGVEKKIINQAKASADLGLNIDFYYFGLNHGLHDKYVHFHNIEGNLTSKMTLLMHRYEYAMRKIRADLYDFIVFRYSGAEFSMLSNRFKKWLPRLITEHHTKEIEEIHHYRVPSVLRSFLFAVESLQGPLFLRKVCGIVGISDDVTNYEVKRAGIRKPSCAISNGVYTRGIPFSRHARYNGKNLNLLFIASTVAPWHGLDRVIAGLNLYDSAGPLIRLHIVGEVPPRINEYLAPLWSKSNVEIILSGRLYGNKLEEVFRDSHLAFTSLALFRNNMQEGSALKTSEYMARGIPFVIGYDDQDLKGDFEFLFRVPPDNTPIDIEKVVTFAENVLSLKGISESMRSYAEKYLDWKVKMAQLWNFVSKLS